MPNLDPFKLYQKHVASDPRIEIPALAAGGALAGRYLSSGAVKLAMRFLLADLPHAQRKSLNNLLSDSRVKTLGTIGGLLLGGGYAAAKHADLGVGSVSEMFKSLIDPQYYKDRPDRDVFKSESQKEDANNVWYSSKVDPFKGNLLGKFGSSGGNPFDNDIIPIKNSLNLIETDKFLKPNQKMITNNIIYGADNKGAGVTSKHDLARSAIRLGVGFTAGYTFGNTVGSILALPPRVTDRVSKIGGIAAAIHQSGIFNQG